MHEEDLLAGVTPLIDVQLGVIARAHPDANGGEALAGGILAAEACVGVDGDVRFAVAVRIVAAPGGDGDIVNEDAGDVVGLVRPLGVDAGDREVGIGAAEGDGGGGHCAKGGRLQRPAAIDCRPLLGEIEAQLAALGDRRLVAGEANRAATRLFIDRPTHAPRGHRGLLNRHIGADAVAGEGVGPRSGRPQITEGGGTLRRADGKGEAILRDGDGRIGTRKGAVVSATVVGGGETAGAQVTIRIDPEGEGVAGQGVDIRHEARVDCSRFAGNRIQGEALGTPAVPTVHLNDDTLLGLGVHGRGEVPNLGEAEFVGDRRAFEIVGDGDAGGRAGGGEARGVDARGEAIAGEESIGSSQFGAIVHVVRHGEGVGNGDGADAVQVRIGIGAHLVAGREAHHGIGHPGAVTQAGRIPAEDNLGLPAQLKIARPRRHLLIQLEVTITGGIAGGAPLAEVVPAGTVGGVIVEVFIDGRLRLCLGAGNGEGVGEGRGLGKGALIGNPAGDDGAVAGGVVRAPRPDIEVGRATIDVLAEVGVAEAIVVGAGGGIPGVEVLAVGADEGDGGLDVRGGEIDGDGDVGIGDVEGGDDGGGRLFARGGDQGGGGGGDGVEGGGHGGVAGAGAEPVHRAIGGSGEDAEGEVAFGAGLAVAGRAIGGRLEEFIGGPDVDGGGVAGAIALGGLAEDAGEVGTPQFRVVGVGEHGHVEREEAVVGPFIATAVEEAEGDAFARGLLLAEVGDHGMILGEKLLAIGVRGVVVGVLDLNGVDGDFAGDGLALVDDVASGEEGAEDAVIQLDVIDAGEGAGDSAVGEGEGVLGDVGGAVVAGGQGDGGEGGGEVARAGGCGGPGDRDVGGGVPLGGRVAIGAAAELNVGLVAAGDVGGVAGALGLQGERPGATGGGIEGVGADDGGRIEGGGGRGGAYNQVFDGNDELILTAALVGGRADDAEAAIGGAEVGGNGDGIGAEVDSGRDDAGGGILPLAHERPSAARGLDLDAEGLIGHVGGEGGIEGDGGDAVGINGGD